MSVLKIPNMKENVRFDKAASPRTISIDKKKISSGTQGIGHVV